ncbi:MAG TPA: helix-turn-helix domain-containing protein [Coleofasciculaceae cyanobacterium]|jgi:HTH-type transcriptional regulator/antitoxin HigA
MAIHKKDLEQIAAAAAQLQPLLKRVETEEEYGRAVEWLNSLLDEAQGNENHPLAPLIDTLGDRIGDYEDVHYPMGEAADPISTLRFLMEQHGLKQKDLASIFGSAGVASEVMSGKRQLNKRHIELLAERFGVSPAVFF